MLRNRNSQKFLATLFAAVYLFVALFSQNFHDHGSGEVFKHFHFTKVDKTFTTTSDIGHYSECLSCHILHEGKYETTQDFFFSAISIEQFQLPQHLIQALDNPYHAKQVIEAVDYLNLMHEQWY